MNNTTHNATNEFTEQDLVEQKYASLWENKARAYKSESEKLNSICWTEIENFIWGLAACVTLILMAFAYVILAGK